MILKDFLYFITDPDGKSYRVNNGNVETTGTPEPLPITPDGWQEKSVKWGRNTRYHGLFRTFTTPMKFVKQAATILRHLAYTVGHEARAFLTIHRLDRSFGNGWLHKLFYTGELDLSKMQDDENGVSCAVIEGGLDKLLKANENTTYEIDLTEIIRHDGVKLRNTANYIITPGVDISNIIYATSYTLPATYLNEDGISPGVSFVQQGLEPTGNSVDYVNTQPNWMAKNGSGAPVTIQITGTIILEVVANDVSGGFSIRFMTSTMTTVNQDTYNFTGVVTAGAVGTKHTFPVNVNITLQPDEALFLRGALIYPTGAVELSLKYLEGSELKLYTETRYEETDINAINPVQLGRELIKKIAGPQYSFQSDYLTNNWLGLKITSGDAIRRITGAKLKTSFADFFDSINAVANVCLFIKDGTVRIEEKGYAFQDVVSLPLGGARDLKVKFAENYLFNTVKVGYPDIKLEDRNGRDEFNVTQQYTSGVSRVVKELNLVSKYSASMYEIEFARINLDGRSTTNSEVDNSVYFIHCNDEEVLDESGLFTYWTIRRDTYDSITGLFDPASAYNIEISPKRNLLRHGNYLRSVFYFNQAGGLTFQSSERNAALTTNIDGTIISDPVVISESANVDLAFLDDPIFIPLEFSFDSKMPIGIVDLMASNPNGTFSFEWDGHTYSGFPLEIGIEPANRPAQESTLLCSPTTDISKLIS